MKSFKTAIIAIVVLAVVIAGYFIATDLIEQSNEANATPTPAATTETIYSYNSDDVVKIVTTGKENFTLELNSEDTWICKLPSYVTASDAAVSNIVTLLERLTGELLYDEGEFEGDLKEYGLDNPYTFTLYFKDDTSVTFKTGDLNPSGTRYYVMLEGSDKIYAVYVAYGEKLRLTQSAITEGDLIVFPDVAKLATVELTKKGKTFYKIEADFEGDDENDKLWNIVAPIEIAGNTSVIDSFIEAVDALTIADTAQADCQDLSQYGLDNPAFRYIFTDNTDTYSIELGNKTADGTYYYCTVNGNNDVFRIYSSYLIFIDNPVLSYAYTYAFFENYVDLRSIDIDIRGDVNKKHQLVFQFGDDNAEMITFNGVDAKEVNDDGKTVYDYTYEVKGITTYCYALQVDAIDTEMSLPKGELLCRITYNRQDGTSCVVEAYERDDATAYMYVDGKYMGGYCDSWRIFSTTDHQGLVGTIDAYEKMVSEARYAQ